MRDEVLLEVMHAAATAVRDALDRLADWGPAGTAKVGQYRSDLVADDAAVGVLDGAGLGVVSEESGARGLDRPILVVVDPVDGSTNASIGLPWFATSLCAIDAAGGFARAAVVVNQATGTRFEAVRGGGARRDGVALQPTGCSSVGDAIVGVSGMPAADFGWRQFRALGAAALDLCAVAAGQLDGYVDCIVDAHGPWDYLGGMLVCREAGAPVVDARGRDLVVWGHDDRRTPVAAASAPLLESLLTTRRTFR